MRSLLVVHAVATATFGVVLLVVISVQSVAHGLRSLCARLAPASRGPAAAESPAQLHVVVPSSFVLTEVDDLLLERELQPR